ncbi:MAG: SUMF1/EgtB/PvdO family nonheme iron enzyme [Verrucomicrobiota bacterium]
MTPTLPSVIPETAMQVTRHGLVFSLLFLLTIPLMSEDSRSGRLAFIVGTNQYEKLPVTAQLENAVPDARRIAATLQNLDLAFEVTLLENRSRNDVGRELLSFIDKSRNAECVLFYFAGHGLEYHGANYLLMRDTSFDFGTSNVRDVKEILDKRAVRLEKALEMLARTEARLTVTILDACRDNPLEVFSSFPHDAAVIAAAEQTGVPVRRSLGHVAAPSGMLLSYSADVGQSANDGLFTEVLCEQIEVPGLNIMEVFARTRTAVRERSKGLDNLGRGVAHEPAEYVKLDPEGLRFSFFPELAAEGEGRERGEIGDPSVAAPEERPPLPSGNLAASREPSPVDPIRQAVENAYEAVSPSSPSETRREIGGVTMIWCEPTGPRGFLVGSPDDEPGRQEDEKQRRVVLTRGFWLAQTEGTTAEWERVVDGRIQAGKREQLLPVAVSRDRAEHYFNSKNESSPLPAGWRWDFPTEAQWEYACRSGREGAFGGHWNSAHPDRFNYSGRGKDGGDHTVISQLTPRLKPVASYPAVGWGFHDMIGNVAEWCRDWYSAEPLFLTDPEGPELGDFRVVKGGRFTDWAGNCRAASRNQWGKEIPSAGIRQAIVFDPEVIRRTFLEAEQRAIGPVDSVSPNVLSLRSGQVYGVGIGSTATEIRAALEELELPVEEKVVDGCYLISTKGYSYRFRVRGQRRCSEIALTGTESSFSNGLARLQPIADLEAKMGQPLHRRPGPNEGEYFRMFWAGKYLLHTHCDEEKILGARLLVFRALESNSFDHFLDLKSGTIWGFGLDSDYDDIHRFFHSLGVSVEIDSADSTRSISTPLFRFEESESGERIMTIYSEKIRVGQEYQNQLRVRSNVSHFLKRFGEPVRRNGESPWHGHYEWVFPQSEYKLCIGVDPDRDGEPKAEYIAIRK